MIQPASKKISADVLKVLDDLQKKINEEATFEKKAAKAQSLWNSKGGKKGKDAFKKITKELYEMCVYVGICNYCEQSEANDIEHIYPKSFFPEYAFNWDNYLLACKQCNSAYKLDRCHVLDIHDEVIAVKRGEEPKYKIIAFINPRLINDDPNQFMLLDMGTCKFNLLPDLAKQNANKAQMTLKILQLNNRDTLITARRSAGIYYYQRLKLLVQILNANSNEEIEDLITPYDDKLDKKLNLDKMKIFLKESFRNHISKYQHPSVWHSIKIIESKVNPKWRNLFNQIPEALTW